MRIQKDESCLVVVDIQERLFPHIYQNEFLTKKCETLIRGMKALNVSTLVTEQYVKGLGSTIEPIKEALGESYAPIEKMSFSCCGEGLFNLKIEEHYKQNIILCGIETHVCVLQTAIDLQENGHNPVVVVDAVSSRNELDKLVAINRFHLEGIRTTTVESILFELCKTSGTDTFKQISALVK